MKHRYLPKSSFIHFKSFLIGCFSIATIWGIKEGISIQKKETSFSKHTHHDGEEEEDDINTHIVVNRPFENAKSPKFIPFGHHGPAIDYLNRSAYAVAYNRTLRNPYWVAEHLTAKSLLHEEKSPDAPDRKHSTFKEDRDIPLPFRSRLLDYKGSHYDRGHMAPCADVKSTQDAINETFLLSNISPQVGKGFNRGYWLQIEQFVRDLTQHFDDVHVVTGPLYLPKRHENGKYYVTYEVLGDPPNTAVPTHFFKVILGIQHDEKVALGGFVVPNEPIGETPLKEFIFPVEGKV